MSQKQKARARRAVAMGSCRLQHNAYQAATRKYDISHFVAVINQANHLFLNRECSYDFKSIGQGCSNCCSAVFSVGMLDFYAARRWWRWRWWWSRSRWRTGW